MSSIQGAIAELQDQRAFHDSAIALIDDAIGLLQRINLDAGPAASPPEAAIPAPADSPSLGTVARVARVMRAATTPLAKHEICARGAVTSSQAGYALQRLADAGAVSATGSTTDRRYRATPEFDVVWDGAKDRAGTAPSLVPR